MDKAEESTNARLTRQVQEQFRALNKGRPPSLRMTVLIGLISPVLTIAVMLATLAYRDGEQRAQTDAMGDQMARFSNTLQLQNKALTEAVKDFTAALNQTSGALGSLRGDVVAVSDRLDMFKHSVDKDQERMEREWMTVRNRQDTIRKALARFEAFHERAPGG